MVTKDHPTTEEREERVNVELPADHLIEGVLAVDPDEDEDSAAE